MTGEIISFRALPIGAHFACNGFNCVKCSPTEATLGAGKRRFHFSGTEVVSIGWVGEE